MITIGYGKLTSIILGVVGGGMVGAVIGIVVGATKIAIGRQPDDETWKQCLTVNLIEGLLYGALLNTIIIILFY